MALDIVDILLAKRQAQGEAATIMTNAQKALSQATSDKNDIADLLTAAQADADAIADIEEALPNAMVRADTVQNFSATEQQTARANIGAITASDIILPDETTVTIADSNTSAVKTKTVTVTKGASTTVATMDKRYTATGNNEDGSMTQKAITAALKQQSDTFDKKLANYTPSGGSSGGTTTLDAPAGTLVIVGEHGELTPSSFTEAQLVELQLQTDSYNAPDGVLGLEIDYKNNTLASLKSQANAPLPNCFKRKRCIVADDGTIVAWEGAQNYTEDGSLGQVMVYQPCFYYMRVPIDTYSAANGTAISKERLFVSDAPRAGFTIHPLFIDENGNSLTYVLLSAFEGSLYNSNTSQYVQNDNTVDLSKCTLSSVAGVKPTSGANKNFSVTTATNLATKRGTGWTITNMQYESAQQMLMVVNYASLNMQIAFARGIVDSDSYSGSINGAFNTGSTQGSISGSASTSTQQLNNNTNTFTTAGKVAINYLGVENPYGNTWRMIGGCQIIGNGSTGGGYMQINGNTVNIQLPNSSDWISAFGYDTNYPWVFLPIATGGSSAAPVGDKVYVQGSLNGTNGCRIGGMAFYHDEAGIFNYAFDHSFTDYRASSNARLLYIPDVESAQYSANIISYNTIIA